MTVEETLGEVSVLQKIEVEMRDDSLVGMTEVDKDGKVIRDRRRPKNSRWWTIFESVDADDALNQAKTKYPDATSISVRGKPRCQCCGEKKEAPVLA